MFDALRTRLSRAIGRSTRFPPPTVPDLAAASAVKADLTALLQHSSDHFRRHFLKGLPLAAEDEERAWFAAFERVGLTRRALGGVYRPSVRVFPLDGAMIATDLLSHRDPDQVFSLMLEQVYMVRNFSVRPGDDVLEICVGSGVNSLFASDHAGSVTSVDISERALAFARFNAALNPGAVPIELLHGSLFEPLAADAQFDVVLVNPPFELVPPGADYYLHSHGGADGMDVIRTILEEAPRRLRPGGRFEIVTATPATAERMLLEELLVAAFPDDRIDLHDVASEPVENAFEPFKDRPGFAAWRDDVRRSGILRLHLAFATVTKGGGRALNHLRPVEQIAESSAVANEWE